MELHRFSFIYLLLLLTVNLSDSLPTIQKDSSSGTKKGCAKGALYNRNSLSKPKGKEIHIITTDINAVLSGIKKRSAEEDDCTEKKSETPSIHENAVGTLHTEVKAKKSEQTHLTSIDNKKSELSLKLSQLDKKSHSYPDALSHIMKDLSGAKRTVSKTPNLKTLKNSPLWSLSKLIDDVSAITAKKSHKNATETKEPISETHVSIFPLSDKHKTGTVKATLSTTSENKGLKATLAKAIAKVEKVVASKNAAQRKIITTVDKPITNLLEKDKAIVNSFEKDKPILNPNFKNKTIDASKKTSDNATATKPKAAPPDPYAEIAAGPDRPKLPELKGADTAGASDGPLMKLGSGGGGGGGGGSAEQVVSDSAKGAKPLSGQHDVGGLLDSLTDKLNAAGGGVATDQPISGNEVKYLQTQLGMEDETGKQAEPMPGQGPPAIAPEVQGQEQAPEAPPEAVPEQGVGPVDKLKDEADMNEAHRIAESSGTAKMEAPQEEEGLDKEVMEKLANTEEGLSKSIADKANSLSKLGALDILKGAQKGAPEEMTDYSDADISPGPDPYAIPSAEPGRAASNMPVGANYNSQELETSNLLNSGNSLQGSDGLERGVSEGFAQSDAAGFEQREEGEGERGFGDEITGNTRSRTKNDDSYISEAMNAMGDTPFTTRQNIPDALWDGAKGLDGSDSYNTNYNTQMFKKNIILRPKKDNYVSPFSGKESFENDV